MVYKRGCRYIFSEISISNDHVPVRAVRDHNPKNKKMGKVRFFFYYIREQVEFFTEVVLRKTHKSGEVPTSE